MADWVQQLLDFLSLGQSWVGVVVLFLSSLVEYVFPPFPGDTVTLFGAFLAAHRGWSIWVVGVACTAGSVAGALIDYGIGYRLRERPGVRLSGRLQRAQQRVAPILEKFRRYGAVYVALNRFLPGIRALFFVAAGMAGLSWRQVIFWGTVSAVVWNALIISVGFAVGKNWDRLLELLQTYTMVVWLVIGLVAVVAAIRFWRR